MKHYIIIIDKFIINHYNEDSLMAFQLVNTFLQTQLKIAMHL